MQEDVLYVRQTRQYEKKLPGMDGVETISLAKSYELCGKSVALHAS